MRYGLDQDLTGSDSTSDEFEDAREIMNEKELGRRLPPLKPFNGIVPQNNLYAADEWLAELNTHIRLTGVEDFETRKDWLMLHLEGNARGWFSGLPPDVNNWEALENNFLNYFRPPNIEQTLTAQLVGLRQGKMTVTEYSTRFNTLRNRCIEWLAMSDTAALGVFRRGLNTEYATQASRATGVKTIEELLPVLLDLERHNMSRNDKRTWGGPSPPNDLASRLHPPMSQNYFRPSQEPKRDADGDVQMRLNAMSYEDRRRCLEERRCFKCGKRGHFSSRCNQETHSANAAETEDPDK